MSDPKEMFDAAAMDSYIEAMEALEAEIKTLKQDVEELADSRVKHIEEKFLIRAERDRYRDLLEKLAAGKFESGDHAQELAADTLGGNCNTEESS